MGEVNWIMNMHPSAYVVRQFQADQEGSTWESHFSIHYGGKKYYTHYIPNTQYSEIIVWSKSLFRYDDSCGIYSEM